MSRWSLSLAILVAYALASGCSMCCGPFDYEYPIMNNPRYTRTNPEYGRVGSIFTDPNVAIGVAPLSNADVPREDSFIDEEEFEEELENIEPGEDDEPSLDTDPDTVDTSQRAARWSPTPNWQR